MRNCLAKFLQHGNIVAQYLKHWKSSVCWGREEIAVQTASRSHSPRLVHTTGPSPLLVHESWVTWWQFKSDYACSWIISDHQWCNHDRGGHCSITELTVKLTTAMGQREEVYLLGVLPPSRPLLLLCLLWVLLTAPKPSWGLHLLVPNTLQEGLLFCFSPFLVTLWKSS